MLTDRYGRTIETLRISVTDRCNLRCRYCLPPEGVAWVPPAAILRFEEIVRIVRSFLALGGRAVRVTGGEPLVRKDLHRLIAQLAGLPGLRDLGLTTNGVLLAAQAAALKAAGLRRINISLDTLHPLRFQWIALHDAFARVWAGFEAACREGFAIKLNTVVLRGITEAEVLELTALAAARGIEVRFIEFMPLCGGGWRPELQFPLRTVREWIARRFTLTPLPRGHAPAASFRLNEGPGRVGFIASLSEPFCDRCSRLRLTASGRLRPCLFSATEYDVQPFLQDADDARLQQAVRTAVEAKPAGHGVTPHGAWRSESLPRIRQVGG